MVCFSIDCIHWILHIHKKELQQADFGWNFDLDTHT